MADPVKVVEDESGRFRVVVVDDPDPQPPNEDDYDSPVLLVTYKPDGHRVDQVGGMACDLQETGIIEALARWHNSRDVFERYCRIWHGARTFAWLADPGGDIYVRLDPEVWRSFVGLTDEHLAAYPETRTVDLSEWKAYVAGEVYVARAERGVRWTSEDGDTRVEWRDTGTRYSFYGLENVESVAQDMLTEEVDVHVTAQAIQKAIATVRE